MSESEPLPAEPGRQANAMLTACDYQVWQTVAGWLDLRGTDVLYVEGAEDFDVVGAEQGEAVQVKASADPISLGQKGVQEALNNYWRLRQASSQLPVSLRFLTRAPFTTERGGPFGAGVSGLELWSRSALTDAEVQSISNFLVEQNHISDELRLWLRNAEAPDVRIQLIDRVIWQTSAGGIDFVERSIYGKLATFAETRGYVPPVTKIKQVAQALHAEVWKALREAAPRTLDRFRLLEVWDEETRVSVPQAELDVRILNAARASAPLVVPTLLQRGLPPLPGIVSHRKDFVSRLCGLVAVTGLLNFHGSTRTGKTTLAKLVAAADADRWCWWSAARRHPSEIQRGLRLVAEEVMRQSDITSIILDDIDFSPTAVSGAEATLGEIIAVIRGRRGRIVVTSQKPLPPRLRHAFSVSVPQVIGIP